MLATTLCVAALAGCTLLAAHQRNAGSLVTASADTTLFSAVVRALQMDTTLPIRVDPRMLAADPRIVSLWDVDRVSPQIPTPPEQAFAPDDAIARERNGRILAELRVPTTDAITDARCPGAMLVSTEEVIARRALLCPDPPYRSIVIGIPREGGPYWPGNIDERSRFSGRDVRSVRVIARHVSRKGSAEASYDYVFERDRHGRWQFVAVRSLLNVE
jgi:hypothetical protein